MKVSRISLAVKSAFVLSLPLLLLGCQGGSSNSSTPTPPAGNVSASISQVTPAVQSVTISNDTKTSASVAITSPAQAAYFDFYTLNQGNAPAWCTGNTCVNPCSSTTFSLGAGQSCKFYLHATNAIAVGNTQAHDQIQVSINGKVNTYSLTNTGVLYAAGGFTHIDGQASNYVASWNGQSWSPMSGLLSSGYALEVAPNGSVYAGTDSSGVMQWLGNSWSAVGNPLASTNGLVTALAFDGEGNLYAGGEFTNIRGVPANRVAEFNGQEWVPVTNPLAVSHGITSGIFQGLGVNSLQYYNGKLYMGGYFSDIDAQPANSIAVWNPQTQTWLPLASGFDSGVNSLAFDQHGSLFIGGDFGNAQGQYVGHIVQFNGQSFTGVTNPNSHDHGLNVQSYALAFDGQNNLYSGGNFTQADDTSANYIASFNGTSWDAVTSPNAIAHGMGGVSEPSVGALAYDANSHVMFAGGSFTTVDNLPMNNLAAWNGVNWLPVTNSAASTHGFDAYVDALAIGNQLTVTESNS